MIGSTYRRFVAAGVAAGIVITGFTALAISAGAYGGEDGVMLIRGPGSGYTAGFEPAVAIQNVAGATNTFGFEVRNDSPVTAQYNIRLNNQSYTCAPGCPTPVVAVSQGSLVTTPLVEGPNGYFTAPIASGKTVAYTLKVTIPKGTEPSGAIDTILELDDTAHNLIGYGFFYSNVTQTKGTATDEEFVSGSGGQKPVSDSHTLSAYVTDPAVKVGGSSVFTVKLQNDSGVPSQIHYRLQDAGCGFYYPATVKVGTTDVTVQAENGTYVSPTLAPGKNVTLTVTVKYLASPANCGSSTDVWQSETLGTGGETVDLGSNPLVN